MEDSRSPFLGRPQGDAQVLLVRADPTWDAALAMSLKRNEAILLRLPAHVHEPLNGFTAKGRNHIICGKLRDHLKLLLPHVPLSHSSKSGQNQLGHPEMCVGL